MQHEAVYLAPGRLLGPEGEIPHSGGFGGADQGPHLSRSGVLRVDRSRRGGPVIPIESRRFLTHTREVIGNFSRRQFGQPTPGKPPYELLRPAQMPVIERLSMPLIVKELRVQFPEQTPPGRLSFNMTILSLLPGKIADDATGKRSAG